jgi:hypothetical protein
MTPRRKAAILAACSIPVAAIAAWAVWTGRAGAESAPANTPHALAAVLVPQPGRCEIVVVDLAAMRVARRVQLRSLSTDMAVDEVGGTIVTAQAGGLGPDADNALGLIDPKTGAVRYVRLAEANPGSVACVDGRAYALHGWCDGGRQLVSTVDVSSGTLVGSGLVPATSGVWTSAGGSLWTVAVPGDGSTTVVRIDPSDLSTTAVCPARGLVGSILADGPSLHLLYPARAGDSREATTGSIVEIDPSSGAEMRGAIVARLEHGPARAVAAGKTLAVIDWNGEEPESDSVTLLDRGTLGEVATVRTGGVPCALASWEGRALVVDRLGGKLLAIDAASHRVVSSVDLGAKDLVFSDVEVVAPRPAGSRGSTPRKPPTAL